MTGADVWRARAEQSWAALQRAAVTRLPLIPPRIHEPGRLRVVFAWPLSQVLHASVLLRACGCATGGLDPDTVWRSFRRYRRGSAFLDIPVVGRRYYDDNAWIGLACAQAALMAEGVGRQAWTRRAERSMAFVQAGLDSSGGMRWVEGGDNLHACSTGSAGALAAALGRIDGWAGSWSSTVRATAGFLEGALLRTDGLVADNVAPDGRRDEAVYTYNQALLVQLRLARADIDGAAEAAQAGLREFPADRLFAHPAAFNAIFFRSLLRLSAETGDPQWRRAALDYLDRCWAEGRGVDGLFISVGRYDSGVVLDHAALCGLMAAAALDRDQAVELY
jgi:hypothetical protein